MAELNVTAFGFDPKSDRNLFHLPLEDLKDYPKHLPLYSPHHTLFIACDSENILVADRARFAEMALHDGAVYVYAWGPDCERVHDIFDETIVEYVINSAPEKHAYSDVMTTWHSTETLEEALDFFLFSVTPGDEFANSCKAATVVSVNNKSWSEFIDKCLRARVPADARTYVYSGNIDGSMWIRDDFDEPLEDFAEYM